MLNIPNAVSSKPAGRPKWASASSTITMIATMVALVIASFLYIVHEHRHLGDVRDTAREMRRTRQALMAVDRTVLLAMAGSSEQSTPVAYGRDLSVLSSFGAKNMPAHIMRGNTQAPTKAVIAR